MRSPGDGSRTALIIGLLLVSLSTTALLFWQAHYAVRSHRAAAENVLRDYASLAASELVRRGAARIGYEGYYPLVTALSRRLETGADLESAVRVLEGTAEEKLRGALPLAREYFVVRGTPTTTEFSRSLAGDGVRRWLSEELGARLAEGAPYSVRHRVIDGDPTTVVFQKSDGTIAGFVVDPSALGSYLRLAFEASPLLPPSLGKGDLTNEPIFASVIDHGGVERFRSKGEYVREFGVEIPFGDAYGGVLNGSRALLSIHPDAAPRLVIGGLPPSRLPMLLGLLLLTAGLLATAMLQLHRERLLQRLRAEFVASVSHELRTPLTQIRMFAETLRLGRVRSEEETRRSLQIIDREVRRLAHLVENVLSFSRVERQNVTLAAELAELGPRIRETLELFQPLAEGADVRIATRIAPDVRAIFDADAVRQVLLNLLDNAVKYGPRGQTVMVSVESKDGVARITIEDEGPGVPLAERKRVFERFYRLPREQGSATAGAGIGLSVVSELVSRQGGRSLVESAEGGGARMVVELPGGGG